MDDLITEFRQIFTEFADEEKFPNSVVSFWLGISENLLSAERFGKLYKQALFLFTAHKLSIWFSMQKAAATDNYGRVDGDVSSKSVGNVSVTLANTNVGYETEGELCTTAYGRGFLSICNALCFGAVQL